MDTAGHNLPSPSGSQGSAQRTKGRPAAATTPDSVLNAKDTAVTPPRGILDVPLRAAPINKQVEALIVREFTLRGAEMIHTPTVTTEEFLNHYAPRVKDDLIRLRHRSNSQVIVLNPEHTAGAAFRVARDRAEIRFPYLCCQYAPAFRDEFEVHDTEPRETSPKAEERDGRYGSFIQADLDLFDEDCIGLELKSAQDTEIILAINDTIQSILDSIDSRLVQAHDTPRVLFRVTDRQLLDGALLAFGITDPHYLQEIVSALDEAPDNTLEHFFVAVRQKLQSFGTHPDQRGNQELSDEALEFLFKLRSIRGSAAEIEPKLEELARAYFPSNEDRGPQIFSWGIFALVTSLRLLENLAGSCGMAAIGDASLARTCPIKYNGIEWEASLTADPQFRSIAGGGRSGIAERLPNGKGISLTGGAIGVDRLIAAVVGSKAYNYPTGANVVVTIKNRDRADLESIVHNIYQVRQVSSIFRERDINALMLSGYHIKKWDEQRLLAFALAKRIPYIYFADSQELIDVEYAPFLARPLEPHRFHLPANSKKAT